MAITSERIEGTLVDIQSALARINQYCQEQEEKYESLRNQTGTRIEHLEDAYEDKVHELEQAKVAAAKAAECAAFAHGQYQADVAGLQSSLDVARAAVDELINRLEIRTGRSERAEYERRWPWLRDLQQTRPQVSADPPADEKLTDAELVQLNKAFRQSKQDATAQKEPEQSTEELQHQLRWQQEETARLMSDVRLTVTANKSLQARNNELLQEIDKLQECNKNLQTQVFNKETRIQQLSRDKHKLLEQADKETAALRDKQFELEKKLVEFDGAIKSQSDEIAKLNRVIRTAVQLVSGEVMFVEPEHELWRMLMTYQANVRQLQEQLKKVQIVTPDKQVEQAMGTPEQRLRWKQEEVDRLEYVIKVAMKLAADEPVQTPEPHHQLWTLVAGNRATLQRLRNQLAEAQTTISDIMNRLRVLSK